MQSFFDSANALLNKLPIIQNWVPQASTYADDIDALITLVAVIVGFWFLLVEGVFFYFIFRYRKKPGVKAGYVTGDEKDLKRWVSWPHYIILVLDVMIIAFAVNVWFHIKQDLPQADNEVRVIGQQWAWSFVHAGADKKLDTADDIAMADELHVQVGSLYHFQLESADVLHSFSVPVFRLKQDAIPGRVITGWFQPTEVGQHDIQCAEMCGIGHGIMGARIYIESPEEHAAWVATHSPPATRLAAARVSQ